MNKALFLDRDGVINVDKGYVHKIEDFEFIPGIFEVLQYFQDRSYLLIIVTNQAGIGRGYYKEGDFHRLNDWMLRQFEKRGIRLTKVYYSSSHPDFGIGEYKREDMMRKPNPGMIIQAGREYDIDLLKSVLIGDKETDIEAGLKAGVGKTVLLHENPDERIETRAHFRISSLEDLKLISKQLI